MIIGVTGPLGAGKDTAADYLADKIGAMHVSGGDILREMLSRLGLEPKKSALGDFGTFLRTHYGQNVITKMVEERAKDVRHLVVSGFRSPLEAKERQEHGGIVVYIDAPNELRYERILSRKRAHDAGSLDELRRLDSQERDSADPMAENLSAVKAIADIVIVNDGTLLQLHEKLDELIQTHNLIS